MHSTDLSALTKLMIGSVSQINGNMASSGRIIHDWKLELKGSGYK